MKAFKHMLLLALVSKFAMQTEVKQLFAEINHSRVIRSHNGRNLLSMSMCTTVFYIRATPVNQFDVQHGDAVLQ